MSIRLPAVRIAVRCLRVCLGLCAGAAFAAAPGEPSREDQIKAALIVKIAKFVEWPATVLAPGYPLTICAAADTPVADALAVAVTRMQRERPLRLQRLSALTAAELRDCHVLFVGGRDLAASGTAPWRGRPLLTISDGADFARRYGIVGLVPRDNRLSFEINLRLAREGGLQLAAPLLDLATVVD